MLPLSLETDHYVFDGDSIPAVSASASRDDSGSVHITLVNMDPNRPRTIAADIRGQSVSRVTGRILTGDAMNAHNTFEPPSAVHPVDFTGARLAGGGLTVDLPANLSSLSNFGERAERVTRTDRYRNSESAQLG